MQLVEGRRAWLASGTDGVPVQHGVCCMVRVLPCDLIDETLTSTGLLLVRAPASWANHCDTVELPSYMEAVWTPWT